MTAKGPDSHRAAALSLLTLSGRCHAKGGFVHEFPRANRGGARRNRTRLRISERMPLAPCNGHFSVIKRPEIIIIFLGVGIYGEARASPRRGRSLLQGEGACPTIRTPEPPASLRNASQRPKKSKPLDALACPSPAAGSRFPVSLFRIILLIRNSEARCSAAFRRF